MTPRLHEACLLAGSNIDPEKNLPRALELLEQQVRLVRRSSIWQSASVGSPGPDFLNVALLVRTPLSLERLKQEVLRPLESDLGRVRTSDKNAPRPIDLDIVIFDGQVLDPNLFIYAHRAVPVAQVLPSFSAGGSSLEQVASELSKSTPIHVIRDVHAGRENHSF